MNKYLLADALIMKGKESASSLEHFLTKLNSYLKETHREKLLKDTLLLLKSKRIKSQNNAKILSSKELTEKEIKNIKEKHEDILKEKNLIYEIDKDLIGGYRIETINTRVDTTYKRELSDLYQLMSKE